MAEHTPHSPPPIDLLYRTIMTRERSGPYGWLMRHIAAHPVRAGFVGGVLAVVIALVRGWKGAQTMPEAAALLCVLVILVWCVLFFFMRRFFSQQVNEQVEVVRRLQLDATHGFVWAQGNTILCEEPSPSWRLCRPLREDASAPSSSDDREEERPAIRWPNLEDGGPSLAKEFFADNL